MLKQKDRTRSIQIDFEHKVDSNLNDKINKVYRESIFSPKKTNGDEKQTGQLSARVVRLEAYENNSNLFTELAKKENHILHLTAENKKLRSENEKLKEEIAETIGLLR